MDKEYARVVWTADDVQTLRPDMSDEAATAFLENNQRIIQDRLVETGWEVIETLLAEENK